MSRAYGYSNRDWFGSLAAFLGGGWRQWLILTPLAAAIGAAVIGACLPVSAQRLDAGVRDWFLADPLATQPRDPLLPAPVVERALSPLEMYDLRQALTALDQEAQAQLAVGNQTQAFELWLREVRLQRLFGLAAELSTLEAVSQQAWALQRPIPVQLLTLRLRQIWQNPTEPLTEAELVRIAAIFTILRDRDSITALNQQLADLAAQRGDGRVQRQRLADLAALYLQWFDYGQAAVIYERLWADVAAGDSTGPVPGATNAAQQIAFLQPLIYCYQQNRAYAQAIEAQRRLQALYQAQGETVPALELAIARNYRALNQLESALEQYRVAYRSAQTAGQLNDVSQVLQDLGRLYRTLDRPEDALQMYELLIRVERQADDAVGLLQTYDQIGQIYQARGNRDQALAAFQAALALAEQLTYRQDYFQAQLEALQAVPEPP
jgi:tetratricopeptide (TPR) repeat protein